MATWVCVFLALLLFALFVTLLVGRRSVSSLIAYFATALLPLMAGLCGVAAGTIDALSSLGASGLAYPANYSSALGRIVISFYTGATVTFFGVVGTMVLGFVGPSKASVPPPDPPK